MPLIPVPMTVSRWIRRQDFSVATTISGIEFESGGRSRADFGVTHDGFINSLVGISGSGTSDVEGSCLMVRPVARL